MWNQLSSNWLKNKLAHLGGAYSVSNVMNSRVYLCGSFGKKKTCKKHESKAYNLFIYITYKIQITHKHVCFAFFLHSFDS